MICQSHEFQGLGGCIDHVGTKVAHGFQNQGHPPLSGMLSQMVECLSATPEILWPGPAFLNHTGMAIERPAIGHSAQIAGEIDLLLVPDQSRLPAFNPLQGQITLHGPERPRTDNQVQAQLACSATHGPGRKVNIVPNSDLQAIQPEFTCLLENRQTLI
jgi:hypothetical protein